MRVDELDYELPQGLIAQAPAPQRRDSRLLIVDRGSGCWRELHFSRLGEALRADDVLVVNDARVVPARFFLQRASGGIIEGLWLGVMSDGSWRVLLRGAARLTLGERLRFRGSPDRYEVTRVASGPRGEHFLRVEPGVDPHVLLDEIGVTPLPPYIKRRGSGSEALDRERYQTVYARRPGAVAAPTAGLHFDDGLLSELQSRGIGIVKLTLHVGHGTFAPIEVSDLRDHAMHAESYEVSSESWREIQTAKQDGRRILAVGTTSARVLEAIARQGGFCGSTNMFIYPPYTFMMIDGLITNFHFPRSTLLAMIYAFGGTDLMRRAYQHAIAQRFRFYSYGDAMLIL